MLSDWEARTKAMDATEGGEAPPEVTASAPAAERLSTGTIDRAELVPWLSAGLGRFLQRVEVEAVTEGGKFVGFRIVAIDAQGTGLEKVDLLPGDVITSVNQQPVERPEQATQVWESLKSAPELVVHYLRDGQVRQLHFTIVDAKTKG